MTKQPEALLPLVLKRRQKRRRRTANTLRFSIPNVARELDVSESTLRRAIKNGEVDVVRFGGRALIPPREIERLREVLVEREGTTENNE